MEERDDHLASRLGKSADAIHRVVGFCQMIEYSFDMVNILAERFNGFENQSTSSEFLMKCETLFGELYESSINNNRCFLISADVVERTIDVISGNLEQYKLLMFVPQHEGTNQVSMINKPADLSKFIPSTKKEKKRLLNSKKTHLKWSKQYYYSTLYCLH